MLAHITKIITCTHIIYIMNLNKLPYTHICVCVCVCVYVHM